MTIHTLHLHTALIRRFAVLAVVLLVVIGFGSASLAAGSGSAGTAPVAPGSTPVPTSQATTQWLADHNS